MHRVEILQRMHVGSAVRLARSDSFDERLRTRHRRHTRHSVLQRRATNRLFVVVRSSTKGRIDYEGYVTALDVVHDVWPSFVDLEHRLDIHSDFKQPRRRTDCGHNTETSNGQTAAKDESLAQ